MRETSLSVWLRRVWPYIGVVVGLVVLASPVIADLIETWRARTTVSEVTAVVEQIPDDAKAEYLRQAEAYNEELATNVANGEVLPYEQQLAWDASRIMCYVEIPRIDVRLAVYHGTSEADLMVGAGHVEGTSLPVGGASTHCAISAHSGMPTARMFDDIHDLVPGDLFVVWTLGEPHAYRVTGSETVKPDDIASLAIEQGSDLCTLVTCTPYGVNSLRLLVRGERCPYEEAEQETPPVMYVSPRAWPLVIGLMLSGGALALSSWRILATRRRDGRPGSRARGRHRSVPRHAAAGKASSSGFVRILPYLGVLVGLLIIAVPLVCDRLEAWHAANDISTLSSTIAALPADEKEYLLEQAQRYNEQLAGDVALTDDQDGAPEGELLAYEQQLCADSTSIMAWLEVPSIELRLPVYHGTADPELAAGVGHMEGSSLPVGGPSTHCVLTAHSGMPSARMFDDIRLLVPGDVFVIWTLGSPYAYEVTGSETVLPDEVATLGIRLDEDLCTLVTCTPYGVNSHRLLVHARRCAWEPEEVAEAPQHVTSRNLPLMMALVAVVAVVCIVACVLWMRARRRARADRPSS